MCKKDWLLENHFVKDNLPHRLSNRTTSKVVTTGTKKADEIHGRHASPQSHKNPEKLKAKRVWCCVNQGIPMLSTDVTLQLNMGFSD